MSGLFELEEIQLVQAMFMDDLVLTEGNDDYFGKLELDLKPNTAMNDDQCFIQCKLEITLKEPVILLTII